MQKQCEKCKKGLKTFKNAKNANTNARHKKETNYRTAVSKRLCFDFARTCSGFDRIVIMMRQWTG